MFLNVIEVVGVLTALLFGVMAIVRADADARQRDEDRRSQFALDLQRDMFIAGETADAVRRLASALRAAKDGSTWYLIRDEDLEDSAGAGGHLKGEQIADFYRVVALLQRCNVAIQGRLVDKDLLFSLVG